MDVRVSFLNSDRGGEDTGEEGKKYDSGETHCAWDTIDCSEEFESLRCCECVEGDGNDLFRSGLWSLFIRDGQMICRYD